MYGEFWMESFRRTLSEVELSVVWGTSMRPDKATCIKNLRRIIIDDCDRNTIENPLNWKGGGRTVGDSAQWSIRPRNDRVPARRKRTVNCEFAFDNRTSDTFYAFRIAGYGFLDADNGIALYHRILADCQEDLVEWAFAYASDMSTNSTIEWTAEYKSLRNRVSCVVSAIRHVSGLHAVDCREQEYLAT
ncbi:hypothetical protein DRE_04152 [Drechslerella stenobrocha 248]|uniref:Uncharacterized protein n=1 Tax=Drechslerella stenobrocha 248 TaxID=1043628 RepID=W7IC48_9PEZI|nr:hypothetical protein DRE_04152 [Drechslerella stenobrocha 248]